MGYTVYKYIHNIKDARIFIANKYADVRLEIADRLQKAWFTNVVEMYGANDHETLQMIRSADFYVTEYPHYNGSEPFLDGAIGGMKYQCKPIVLPVQNLLDVSVYGNMAGDEVKFEVDEEFIKGRKVFTMVDGQKVRRAFEALGYEVVGETSTSGDIPAQASIYFDCTDKEGTLFDASRNTLKTLMMHGSMIKVNYEEVVKLLAETETARVKDGMINVWGLYYASIEDLAQAVLNRVHNQEGGDLNALLGSAGKMD